jgi:hypothetical protein
MRSSLFFLILAILLLFPSLSPAEEVLLSAEKNIRVTEKVYSAEDLVPDSKGDWSVTKSVLHGGKQEGVDLVTIDNGALKIVIIPTRGMSLYEIVSGDLRLGWNSPVKEIVHPSLVNLESRGGLGWLEGFNEWMVRCGLEWAGHPGQDRFIDNVGKESLMDLTLHGKIGNIPASEVTFSVDPQPPHTLRLRGRVDEKSFFGPNLELWTEISTVPGSTAFRITDELTNKGAREQEFEIIYHCNFGPPILGPGSRLHLPAHSVAPMNEHAAEGIESHEEYGAPEAGFIEKVYLLQPKSDAEGKTTALLTAPSGEAGVAMTFSTEQLPFFTQWKNTAEEATGYVTGFEPGTSFPYNRMVEREAQRLRTIGSGDTLTFEIEVEVLHDAAGVKKTLERIESIQQGTKKRVEKEVPGAH